MPSYDDINKKISEQVIAQFLDEWMRQNSGRVTQQIYQEVFNRFSKNLDIGNMRQTIQGQRFRFTRLVNQIQQEINRQIAEAVNKADYKPPPEEFEIGGTKEQKELQKRLNQIQKQQYKLLEQAIASKERSMTLQSILPGGAQTYNKVAGMAREQGFDTEFDLRSVTRHEPLGVTDITYMRNVEGVMQKMRVTVNKFGEVMVHTQRRLQGFFTAVGKDVIEFTKWSLAVGLVLGPISKLNDLIKQSIENQTKLTNVLIALGNVQKTVNQVFESAYVIAKQSGEAIGGVIDAYTMAYRATGGTVSETERFTVAGKLLADSLILSKLSTLDQAEAIDTLSAALKQSEGELSSFGGKNESVLTKGSTLLDKWVRTTKVANVSLDALATSFSIVGDAAEAAGLGIDELNGVIAVLGEVTGDVSGKEIGNMARALVSGFQSDKAAKQLQSLGIAIQDTTGEARNFMEVYGEISQLRIAGLISDEQLNKITLAIGGGTRRQAIVQAFIEQFGRIKQVSEESMNASGDSAQAMAKQLDTVQTATTRLANAFNSLAQTLGTKGGLLDFFTSILNVATSLVEVLDKLSGLLGRTTPLLLATLGASAYLNYGTGMRKTGAAIGFGDFLGGAVSQVANLPLIGKLFTKTQTKTYTAEGAITETNIPAATKAAQWGVANAGNVASIGLILTSALSNALDKTASQKEKTARIGANIAGGIVGALIGGPVGAIVGSSIAEAFINATVNYKGEWQNFWKEVFPQKPEQGAPSEQAREYFAQERLFELYGQSGQGGFFGLKGNASVGRFMATTTTGFLNFLGTFSGGKITPEQLVMYALQNDPKFQAELSALLEGQELEEGGVPDEFVQKMANIIIPPGLIQKYQKDLREQLLKRSITPTEYTKLSENLAEFETRGKKYYTGFGEQYSKEMGKTQIQTMEDFITIVAKATDEELNYLTNLNSEIMTAYSTMQDAEVGTKEYNDALDAYIIGVKNAIEYTNALNESILSRKEMPEVVDLSEYSDAIIEQLIKLAQQIQRTELETAGFSEAEIQAKLKSYEPFLIKGAEGYQMSNAPVDPKYLGDAVKEGAEKGVIAGLSKIDFQTFDITQGQYLQAMQAYPELAKLLEQKLGYIANEEDQALIFSDATAQMDRKDWKIVQFLLSQILSVEEKQLEGFYNFPEGAVPYVPFTAVSQLSEFARGASGAGGTYFNQAFFDQLIAALEPMPDYVKQGIIEGFASVDWGKFYAEGGLPRVNQTPEQIAGKVAEKTEKDWGKFYAQGGMPRVDQTHGYDDWVLRRMLFGQAPFSKQPFRGEYYPYEPSPFPSAVTPTSYRQSNVADTFKTALSNLSTKLAITINDRITVVMDGRQIATIVKNYLKQDLVKYAGSTSSAKTYTV